MCSRSDPVLRFRPTVILQAARILLLSSSIGFVHCERYSSERMVLVSEPANVATVKVATILAAPLASSPLGPETSLKVDGAPHDSKLREVRFAWKPVGGSVREYEMADPLDQHQVVLLPGVRGHRPKSLIALHGQPRRGQAPRNYEFPRVVVDVARRTIDALEVEPFVLVIPRFRFDGQNWPGFFLDEFLVKVNEVLSAEGITLERPYVFGHSGAAGCGGLGLNRVARVEPLAVGFFDTCIGAGFVEVGKELLRKAIPTLFVHSVETAGYRPRQRTEYLSSFDFGRVYRPIGLLPSPCPPSVPEVPLRSQPYQCSADPTGNTRAFVVDTGEGEVAHNAVVPVALRYFLKEYVHGTEKGTN